MSAADIPNPDILIPDMSDSINEEPKTAEHSMNKELADLAKNSPRRYPSEQARKNPLKITEDTDAGALTARHKEIEDED